MQKLLALLMTTLNTELPLKISKVTPEGGQEKPGALTTEDRPVADLSATAVKTRTVFQEAVARRTIKKWYGVGYRKNSFLLDMAMALSPIGRSLTYLETLAATSGKLGAANGYFAQTPAKIREMVWEKITVLAEKSITEERARKAATAGSDDTASGSNGTGTGDDLFEFSALLGIYFLTIKTRLVSEQPTTFGYEEVFCHFLDGKHLHVRVHISIQKKTAKLCGVVSV